jgi:AcrR family transcriptional regulator
MPSQKRGQRTRARLWAAAEREFSERGYAGATTRSIAERAGVATGSFYQYFSDKDALLRALAQERLQRIASASMKRLETVVEGAAERLAIARAGLRSVVELVMDYHREDPGLHAVLTERRHADAELDALTSRAELALVQRIATLLERWGHPGDRLATAFVLFGAVEGSVHAHVLGAAVVSDERFVEALVDGLARIALVSS